MNLQPSIILIVDDEQAGRETLEALLYGQGYQLTFAQNGPQALAEAARLHPDLILLDVMMPGMDGYEVCRRLRADPALAEVPILMITALDDRDSRLRGIESGADDFISKPVNLTELRVRVRTITRLNRYRRLNQERTRFERIFDLSPNGILIVDNEGQILLSNRAICNMLQIEPVLQAQSPYNLFDFIAPESCAQCIDCLAEVMLNPQQQVQRKLKMRASNFHTFPVEIVAGYFEFNNHPAAQLMVRDITERVQAEQRIQNQLQALQLLYTETDRRLQRIRALRTIDEAITSDLGLANTLQVLLDQVRIHLLVDAASILLYQRSNNTLVYGAVRGFRENHLPNVIFKPGQGLPGRIAQSRQTIHIPRIADSPEILNESPVLETELFMAYVGVPLIAKDELQGVLEICHRVPLQSTPEWFEFMQTLAGQAAIAIHNATLFNDLQQSHLELTHAYEATLEGWVRALDLRDRETEGHTQRVTSMTVRLAREMRFDEAQILQMRRGALLHDIGKIGIPDRILHKPGPLNPEEWDIMRLHPVYAYEMLRSIDFLRNAIDIPYAHHERWDSSGYPRGLQKYEIPLPARLFAIIDVWDALTSNRPYRSAWAEPKVLQYITAQANHHFDPELVKLFVEFINKLRA